MLLGWTFLKRIVLPSRNIVTITQATLINSVLSLAISQGRFWDKYIEWNKKADHRARLARIRSTCRKAITSITQEIFNFVSCSFFFTFFVVNLKLHIFHHRCIPISNNKRKITKLTKKRKINSGQRYKFIKLIAINITRTFDIVKSAARLQRGFGMLKIYFKDMVRSIEKSRWEKIGQ